MPAFSRFPMAASSGERPMVWIADDSTVDRTRAQRALELHYEVRGFADGSAVLEELAVRSPPDALVLDWVMPGITGIDVVHFLRGDRSSPEIPVLLLTVQQRPEQITEGLDAGANDYLAKPYAAEELRARVSAIIRSARLLERAVDAERAVRDVLFTSPDALMALDDQGRVTMANHAAGQVCGCEPDALVGTPVTDYVPGLVDALRAGGSERGTPDVTIGERIYAPSQTAGGPGVLRVLSLRDVTERRQIEARRLDLYSIVAHDLRSPLSALLLRTELLLANDDPPPAPDLRHEIERMRASSLRMVAIINDFLDLARFEGSQIRPRREPVDLGALLATVGEELRPIATAKDMTIELPRHDDAGAIVGDEARLAQVFGNLLSNAIKFGPAGSAVSVSCATGADAVEISIVDRGPGIPADAIPALFNRFARTEAARLTAGTGLGLMIVRQIVEAHGGRAGVQSAPASGTRFWVRLPRASA